MNSVFISYASEDRNIVSRLASDLKSKGLNVWYDQWGLKVGDSIVAKINTAIKSQDYFIVVLSKSSVKSNWVMRELNAGLIKELEEKRIVVLPVIIEDCDIPPLLSDRVYADFRDNYSSGLNRLLDTFPGRLFPSGINIPSRKALPINVYLDNITSGNVSDTIVKLDLPK